MRKRFDDEVAEVMAILDRPDPRANGRSAEAALNMALASGGGPLRQKYLAKAQKFIARMDPEREAEEIQELQGHVLALQGRGGDTRIAHVTAMDRVITVSNSTAHMAGALGIPGFVMLPRGLGRLWYWHAARHDSPWYPSLTLFRQTREDSWTDVVDQVRQKEMAAGLENARRFIGALPFSKRPLRLSPPSPCATA